MPSWKQRVHGNVTDEKLRSMRRGIMHDGIQYKGVKVDNEKGSGRSTNAWLTITCIEGKNRLVRNMCKCLGCKFSLLLLYYTQNSYIHVIHA